MAATLRWWAVPVGVLLLHGIVTLAGRHELPPGTQPLAVQPAEAVAAAPLAEGVAERVRFADASGRRSEVVEFPAVGALQLRLPAAMAEQRLWLRLWRQQAGGERTEVWTATPRVRTDGWLPLAGLAHGLYDLEVALPGQEGRLLMDLRGLVVPSVVDRSGSR
jgi:hypothetical protein